MKGFSCRLPPQPWPLFIKYLVQQSSFRAHYAFSLQVMKFIGAFLWSFSEMDLKSCDAGWHSVIFLFIEGFPTQNCCCCPFVLSWRTEWGTLRNMCAGCKAVWYHLSSQGGVCRWRRDVQWDHARVGHQDPNWPWGGPEQIRCWVGAMFSAYRHHPCRWAFFIMSNQT